MDVKKMNSNLHHLRLAVTQSWSKILAKTLHVGQYKLRIHPDDKLFWFLHYIGTSHQTINSINTLKISALSAENSISRPKRLLKLRFHFFSLYRLNLVTNWSLEWLLPTQTFIFCGKALNQCHFNKIKHVKWAFAWASFTKVCVYTCF